MPVIFALAALTDWLDGYLARLNKQTSTLGRISIRWWTRCSICGAFIFLCRRSKPTSAADAVDGRRWWYRANSSSPACAATWKRSEQVRRRLLGKLKMGLAMRRLDRHLRGPADAWPCAAREHGRVRDRDSCGAMLLATVLSGLQYSVERARSSRRWIRQGDRSDDGLVMNHPRSWCRHRRLRHDRTLSRPGPGRGARHAVGGAGQPQSEASARKLTEELGVSARHCGPTWPPVWPAPTFTSSSSPRRHGAHLEPAVGGGTAGKHVVVEKPLEDHARTLRPHHRRLRPQRRQALHHLPVALRRRQPDAEGRRGRGTLRPADAGRDDLQMVALAGIITTKAAGRARKALDGGGALDEPGDPQRRSAAVDDGPGDAHLAASPPLLAHERIEVEDTAVACLRFAQRRARRDPGDDERPPGPAEDDRRPRRPRIGGDRAGRRAALGLRCRN